MPTTGGKYLKGWSPPGTGGSPAPPAVVGNVAWGPFFGDPNNTVLEFSCAATMPALAIVNTQTLSLVASMPSVAASYQLVLPASLSLTGTATGPPFWQNSSSSGINSAVGATSFTIDVPSGTADGDLLLMFIGATGTATSPHVNLPSGWNSLVTQTDQGTAAHNNARSMYRIASSEPATYTITLSATGNMVAAMMHWLTFPDPTTPINASVGNAGNSTSPSCTALTSTVANCRYFCFLWHDHLALAQTHTPPSGFTEHTEVTRDTGATQFGAEDSERVFSSAAAHGGFTITCTESIATDFLTHTIAVAPGPITLA